MARSFSDWIERQSLVASQLKVLYVPTLKAGCTSVMWALAGAEGTVAPASDVSELADQSQDQAIHNPRIHGLPSLSTLSASDRDSILSGPEWIRFCVTRDPYSRILSAWLNRAFLYSTGAEARFVSADTSLEPFPASGDTSVDIGLRFRSFVRRLTKDSKSDHVDAHFATQYSLTRPDIFPYTDVVRLSDLGDFADRIATTIPSRSEFHPLVRNVSLGVRAEEMIDAPTAALINEYYAEDFKRFDYPTKTFPFVAEPMVFTARETALVRMLLERSDRLRELASLTNPPRPVRDGMKRVSDAISRRVRPNR